MAERHARCLVNAMTVPAQRPWWQMTIHYFEEAGKSRRQEVQLNGFTSCAAGSALTDARSRSLSRRQAQDLDPQCRQGASPSSLVAGSRLGMVLARSSADCLQGGQTDE
jgi:hypothetical protein